MRTIKLMCTVLTFSIPIICFGASTVNQNSSVTKNVESMSCQQFTLIDDIDKPKVVYYSIGHFEEGKKVGMIDIENTDRLIPIIIDECKASPKESFWKKLKEKAKQVF